ncbi:MAG: ankyrin repeat domain-containing protein, partial [Shewanella sp.]
MLNWIFGDNNLTLREICVDNELSTAKKIQKINKYLANGGDINFIDPDISPCNVLVPLSRSPESDLELVDYLINKGAQIECNGFSALHSAIEFNNPELVKLYLKAGANLYYQNQFNN